jgi:hypothetical protein
MNSFLQGKKNLAVAPLRPMAGPNPMAAQFSGATVRNGHGGACASSHPTVDVIKEGDKVVRLVVVCSCGERVEIECLYPPGS